MEWCGSGCGLERWGGGWRVDVVDLEELWRWDFEMRFEMGF